MSSGSLAAQKQHGVSSSAINSSVLFSPIPTTANSTSPNRRRSRFSKHHPNDSQPNSPHSLTLHQHRRPAPPYIRWAILAAACFVMVGNYYAFDNPAALNQPLQEYMGLNDDSYAYFINLLYTIYSLPNIVLPWLGGYAADRFGTRLLILTLSATVLFGHIVVTLGVSAKLPWVMYLGRILFGAGESLAVAQSSITVKFFKGKELAMALGINLCVARLGSVLNDIVTPFLWINGSVPLAFWGGVVSCLVSFLSACMLVFLDYRYGGPDQIGSATLAMHGHVVVGPKAEELGGQDSRFESLRQGENSFELEDEDDEGDGSMVMTEIPKSRPGQFYPRLASNNNLGQNSKSTLSPQTTALYDPPTPTRLGGGSSSSPSIKNSNLNNSESAAESRSNGESPHGSLILLQDLEQHYNESDEDEKTSTKAIVVTGLDPVTASMVLDSDDELRHRHGSGTNLSGSSSANIYQETASPLRGNEGAGVGSTRVFSNAEQPDLIRGDEEEAMGSFPQLGKRRESHSGLLGQGGESEDEDEGEGQEAFSTMGYLGPDASWWDRIKATLREVFDYTESFWTLFFMTFLLVGVQVPFNSIHAGFLQMRWYHNDPQKAAAVMTVPDLLSAVLVLPVGYFVDHYGQKSWLFMLCGLIIGVSHMILGLVPIATPIPALMALGISAAIGALFTSAIPALVRENQVGMAYGISTSAMNMAFTFFPLIVAELMILDPTVYTWVEIFFAMCGFLGLILAIRLRMLDTEGVLDEKEVKN